MDEKHIGPKIVTVDGFDIVECNRCGFKHILPLISEKELEEFYNKEYFEQGRPDYFKHAEEDREWWFGTYNFYYELLETHTRGRRLADIGSGPGYFLDVGRERGWDAIGFEPSLAAATYAQSRGLEVVNGFFTKEHAAAYGPFDVIVASFVLEHVRDPHEFLDLAAGALAPGGLLCVIVPNDFNQLQRLLVERHGYKPWWVVPKHHLNYFTTESLTRIIGEHGLTSVEVEESYPMELFLLSGRNYVKDPEVGRACHQERKAMEMALFAGNRALLRDMYRAWAKESIGREIVLIAKKLA